jgi:16S rRNA G966 N2-methylase RsmD
MLISGDMLTGGALIAVESGSAEPTEHEGLRILRHTRYAKTYITLYIYGDGQSEFVTQ